MPVSRRVALVTGGTGALGSVIARRLHAEGALVSVTYRDREELDRMPPEVRSSVQAIAADVANEEEVTDLFTAVIRARGRIEIVVNTVGGFLPRKQLEDVRLEEWERMMTVNLKTTFLCTREALRRMRGQSYGRIINFSAMVGLNPVPGRTAYAISKSGVSLLTELVAQEQKGTGITVNAIAPSIVATPANLEGASEEDSRKWVKPEEIADLVLLLCTDRASAVSGTTLKAYGSV